MIYRTIWVTIYSLKCLKTVWSELFTSTHCSRLVIDGWKWKKLLKLLRILIRVVSFKDQNWISKTVHWISCLVICEIVLCSEFLNIPDNAGRKTTRRRRTQAIAKRYAFHTNAIIWYVKMWSKNIRIKKLQLKSIQKSCLFLGALTTLFKIGHYSLIWYVNMVYTL